MNRFASAPTPVGQGSCAGSPPFPLLDGAEGFGAHSELPSFERLEPGQAWECPRGSGGQLTALLRTNWSRLARPLPKCQAPGRDAAARLHYLFFKQPCSAENKCVTI